MALGVPCKKSAVFATGTFNLLIFSTGDVPSLTAVSLDIQAITTFLHRFLHTSKNLCFFYSMKSWAIEGNFRPVFQKLLYPFVELKDHFGQYSRPTCFTSSSRIRDLHCWTNLLFVWKKDSREQT